MCVVRFFMCKELWTNGAPELHLDKTELLEVCTQLEGSEYGILFSQHDQRGTGQAAVDVKAEPDVKISWKKPYKRELQRQTKQKEKHIQPSTVADSFVPALTCCSICQQKYRRIYLPHCVGRHAALQRE